MSLTLTNIPRIMRSKKWFKGAALLDSWFNRVATTAPKYGIPDTSTIGLNSFVLRYKRARDVYDAIIQDRIWANPAAQREVRDVLNRAGRLGKPRGWFGNINLAAPSLDSVSVNYRTVGFGLSDMDDLSAALGNFTFRVVVAGESEGLKSGETQVYVHQVGIYVRDSFDFNGSQFLGFWDDSDDSVSMVNPLSGESVRNEDFRNHRARTGMGGDFLVYSEVQKLMRKTPDVFTVR